MGAGATDVPELVSGERRIGSGVVIMPISSERSSSSMSIEGASTGAWASGAGSDDGLRVDWD